MTVTRAFWIGMGFAFPPCLILLCLALLYFDHWATVGILWLLCTLAVLELLQDVPTAESLGIPDNEDY